MNRFNSKIKLEHAGFVSYKDGIIRMLTKMMGLACLHILPQTCKMIQARLVISRNWVVKN